MSILHFKMEIRKDDNGTEQFIIRDKGNTCTMYEDIPPYKMDEFLLNLMKYGERHDVKINLDLRRDCVRIFENGKRTDLFDMFKGYRTLQVGSKTLTIASNTPLSYLTVRQRIAEMGYEV